MQRMIAVFCLMTGAAWASDAGTVTDAGGAKVGESQAEWKAKPVFILAENDKVLDAYAIAKPADRAKIKGLLTKATVGARLAGAILLDGYELPYSRRVDVSADVLITDPTGREVVDRASISGASTMDPKTMLLLPLKPVFGLMFGLTDREGEYTVKITVRDNIRGAVTRLETKFVVSR